MQKFHALDLHALSYRNNSDDPTDGGLGEAAG